MPSAAANLARLTHAPHITLIYESGTLATKPNILPLSIGDGELCETAITTVSVPEMFRYWLQGGRIKVGFLGGAQIDKFANLNTTVVGPYDKPKVRLPGGGGAPEIATSCGEIFIIMSGEDPQRNFRFFDNRQKYLLFVNTCSEKWEVASRVGLELANIHPRPPAVRVFDAGVGDGTVLARVMRSM